jgi:hypothetical protein
MDWVFELMDEGFGLIEGRKLTFSFTSDFNFQFFTLKILQ